MGTDNEGPPLTILAPVEAVFWRLEYQKGAKWVLCKLPSNGKGPPRTYFKLEELSRDNIRAHWGEGIYRLVWHHQSKTKRIGTSSTFEIFPSSPPQDISLKLEPPEQPVTVDIPPPSSSSSAASSAQPSRPAMPLLDPATKLGAALAAKGLDGKLLAQVLQGTPADDSEMGQALAMLERISAMHERIEARMFTQVKADTELRIRQAEIGARQSIEEIRERHKAQLAESRLAFEHMRTSDQQVHEAEIRLKDAEARAQVGQLSSQLEQLGAAMQEMQEQEDEEPPETTNGHSPWTAVFADIVRELGPDVGQAVLDIATRGKMGAAVASATQAAPAEPVADVAEQAADFMDGVAQAAPQD